MSQDNATGSFLHKAFLLGALFLALIALPSLFESFDSWKSLLVVGSGGFVLLNLWFVRHRMPEAVFPWVFAIAVFAAVSLAANAGQIKRPENVLQLLTFVDRTPWTLGHSIGLCLALFTITALWKTDQPSPLLPQDGDEIISGPRLISQQEAQRLAAKRTGRGERTIFWAGVNLPEHCGTEHFVVVGTPGSGKTLTLHLLMQTVLSGIGLGLNRRAVIYDAKRDTTAFLAGVFKELDSKPPVVILNPFDARCSPWAMNQDIRDGPTAFQIASILIPRTGRETQPFFIEAAQSLLGGVMEAFCHHCPDTWTLRDVVLALRYPKRIAAILATCVQTHHLIKTYVGGEKRDSDVSATIENYMRSLSFVAAYWHHATHPPISLEAWAKEESILVLGVDPQNDEILRALNRAVFKRLVEITRRLPDLEKGETRQAWFIIDELRNAGSLDDLDKLLVEGRSKGACIVLGFQDLSGLRLVYEDKRADEIIGACANKVFLQNGDQTTIEYATKHFKSQEVIETRVSHSHSESTNGPGGGSRGSSVARQRVTRPVVHEGLLKSLSKPSPGLDGLCGYCDTAAVGTEFPYRMELPPAFLDEHLPRAERGEPNFVPPPKNHYMLPEWEMADLQRLKLDAFPELLTNRGGDEPPDPEHEIFRI